MASEVKTNKISPATGTAFTFGDSGDTFTIPSGVTLANSGTATGFTSGFLGVVVYTADGTYTPGNTNNGTAGDEGNANVTKIIVEVQGAGGGGGGSGAGGYGAGAGGGGYSKAFRSLTDITTCTVTVGDGGTVSNNATGGAGGLSKIIKGSGSGTFADVQGTGGGGGNASAGNGGEGGVGTGGFLHIKGGNGKPNLMGVTSFSAGGNTPFSPTGQHRGGTANPPDATHGYGGGGSGSANSSAGSGASGAEGADGIIILYEFA